MLILIIFCSLIIFLLIEQFSKKSKKNIKKAIVAFDWDNTLAPEDTVKYGENGSDKMFLDSNLISEVKEFQKFLRMHDIPLVIATQGYKKAISKQLIISDLKIPIYSPESCNRGIKDKFKDAISMGDNKKYMLEIIIKDYNADFIILVDDTEKSVEQAQLDYGDNAGVHAYEPFSSRNFKDYCKLIINQLTNEGLINI